MVLQNSVSHPTPLRPEPPSELSAGASPPNGELLEGMDFRSVRLRTLVTLRWLAVIGQSGAVIASHSLLGIELPLAGCTAAIAIAIWLNVVATLASSPNQRLSERDALLTLMFDLAQLSALLFLTGGLTNPFALFLVGPVTISASVLTLRTTLVLGAFSIAAASVLANNYVPLVLPDGQILEPEPLYVIGFWLAIALGVAFQAGYARRVSVEAFNMSTALSATQMALEREKRLSEIGAMAAATAHELGTPLATIKLVAGELKGELNDREDFQEYAEDLALIVDQAKRCRDILQRLSAVRAPEDAQIKTAPIFTVLEEAAGPHRFRRAVLIRRFNGAPIDEGPPPALSMPRQPEIIHGLRNFIQNAVDFASSTVWLDVDVDEETIAVTIGDDGVGFSSDILAQLGEPFATTRGKTIGASSDAYQGMGLGVFIAKTLLERTGAEVSFRNDREETRGGQAPTRTAPAETAHPSGAIVRVAWPRDAIADAAGAQRREDASRLPQTAL